jgi:hypothetical protein
MAELRLAGQFPTWTANVLGQGLIFPLPLPSQRIPARGRFEARQRPEVRTLSILDKDFDSPDSGC